MGAGIKRKSVDSVQWQDYRASNTGMIVYYVSDPISEMPIREIPEDIESPVLPEPNYENRVYGFYGCIRPKIRNAFFKSKIRYLFFLTKYAGIKQEFKDKFMITGYFRVYKTADVQKFHFRYIDESGCMDAEACMALRADEVRFVALQNAYPVNEEKLKSWGYNAKVNKQLRILLDGEKTSELLEYLKSKPDDLEAYIKETKRLEPHDDEEEIEEEDGEALAGSTAIASTDVSSDPVAEAEAPSPDSLSEGPAAAGVEPQEPQAGENPATVTNPAELDKSL